MKKVVIVLLVIAIVVSLINPVKHYFKKKEIFQIPKYISYEDAIFTTLQKQLLDELTEKKCKNYCIPLSEIAGNVEGLASIKTDINLILGKYDGWKLLVDATEFAKMKKRTEKISSDWGNEFTQADFLKQIEQDKGVHLHKDYSVSAEYFKKQEDKPNNCELTIMINDEKLRSQIISIKTKFTHPKTVAKWNSKKKIESEKLAESEKKWRKGLFSTGLFLVLLLVYLLVLLILKTRNKIKRRREENDVLNQIETREELINNGHFVAALELLDRFLLYFPNNIEIVAFRERLLDFTNNDVKKAQVAYVENQKLQLRMKQPQQLNFLSNSEKAQLTNLLPYNPDLKDSYNQLIAYENADIEKNELKNKMKEINKCIVKGELNGAMQVVYDLKLTYPNDDDLLERESFLEHKIDGYKLEFEEIEKKLSEYKIEDVSQKLDKLLKHFSDFKPAITLKDNLQKSKQMETTFLLKNETNEIIVFQKNEIILGRVDDDVKVDIALDDRRISRPHLKISVSQKTVTITDLETTGGTYINGEKIEQQRVSGGEQIILAKVIDMDISICKTENDDVGGVVVNVLGKYYFMLINKIIFGFREDKITCKKSDYSLIKQDGVMIFDNQLLRLNAKVLIENNEYKIKEK
jgi:pSer/pThr/pTyr-binding forkhead associated (FHA) protein